MQYVLVDFDGTIIKGDSTKLAFRYLATNKIHFYIIYYLRFIPDILRAIVGNEYSSLKEARRSYLNSRKRELLTGGFSKLGKDLLFDDVVSSLLTLEKEAVTIVIISAGYKEIIEGILDGIVSFICIAVSLQDAFADDINFKEKVIKFNEIKLRKSVVLAAFGNTKGDIPMLQLARKAYWVDKNGRISEFSN